MLESNSRARRYTLGALLCVAAVSVSACAHSQQAPPADSSSPRGQGGWQGSQMRHRGGPRGDRMFEGMNLTNDQRAQIKLIRDRYKLQADSLRMGGTAHDSTSRAAIRSLMTQQMSEIRGVLTPDQQKQFDDNLAKVRERHAKQGGRDGQDDHGGHNGPPPPDNSGGNPPPPSA
jgi:protein CpxP